VDAPVEMDHVPLFGAEPPLNADGDVLRQAAVRRDTMGVGLVLMLSNLEVRPAPVMPLRGAKLLRSNVQRLTSNEDAAERLYCEWPCSRCARARPCCASKPTPAPAKAYGTLGAHAPSPISDAKPMRNRCETDAKQAAGKQRGGVIANKLRRKKAAALTLAARLLRSRPFLTPHIP
jgi:hypothetical protein